MALRFKGRTPSRGTIELKGRRGRPNTAQAIVWRAVAAALVLCVLVTFARHSIGTAVLQPPGSPLQIMVIGQPFQSYRPTATLQSVPVGSTATLGAGWVFLEKWVQELDPQVVGAWGLVWLLSGVLLLVGVWLLLAHLGEWRKPSVPLGILLAFQLFAAAYYFSSFRAPAQKLETRFTAFDFHAHTTRSNGLLTPQQQINWHRARGFNGLAFTDSNRLMSTGEIEALRARNPDMLLVSGSEYHGDAHLLLFGLRSAISSRTVDVPTAVKAAKHQGALVIVAHPWYPARYSVDELLNMGVDGFEAWNGVIWSRDVAELIRHRSLIGTTGTDTLSKSGPHCFTWTLLPRGLKDEGDVLRSLRMRKIAAAFALGEADTPAAFDARRAHSHSPLVLFTAAHTAWEQLSLAQRINTILVLAAGAALLWLWGAGPRNSTHVSAPSRVVGFLRRRRLPSRVLGLLLMLLAFALSIAAALLTMGAHFKGSSTLPTLSPLYAIFAWILLDALYLHGRGLWRRKQ